AFGASALLALCERGRGLAGYELAGAATLIGLLLRNRADLAASAWLCAALAAHRDLLDAPEHAFYWLDCLLAALVLSARLVRDGLPARARPYAYALLALLALFACGWSEFSFTVHRLEWRFLYRTFHAPFVEHHVA